MPKPGFTAVTLKDADLKPIDRIIKRDPHEPSRADVIRAAVRNYAEKLGVPA